MNEDYSPRWNKDLPMTRETFDRLCDEIIYLIDEDTEFLAMCLTNWLEYEKRAGKRQRQHLAWERKRRAS
jgi:hypothetical protein